MIEVDLPEGYFIEEPKVKGKKYTILRREGVVILALRTKHCSPQRIKEVIQSISG